MIINYNYRLNSFLVFRKHLVVLHMNCRQESSISGNIHPVKTEPPIRGKGKKFKYLKTNVTQGEWFLLLFLFR